MVFSDLHFFSSNGGDLCIQCGHPAIDEFLVSSACCSMEHHVISNRIVATIHSPYFLRVVAVQTLKKQRKEHKVCHMRETNGGQLLILLRVCQVTSTNQHRSNRHTPSSTSLQTSVQVNEANMLASLFHQPRAKFHT